MAMNETQQVIADAQPAEMKVKDQGKKGESFVDSVLGLLSSVRFGVTMLVILLICCIIGMVIMQVQVDGFQEYYERITPAQRRIWGALGFFDIYHSWYFTLLLAITGLNIILASIDRFPTAWQYVAKPKLNASPNFIKAQTFNAEAHAKQEPGAVADAVRKAWRKHGFRAKIHEERGRITVFAQRNVWNRLGAYMVHIALLTIFTGGFLTNRYGMGGMMEIRPNKSANTFSTFQMSLEGQKVGQAQVPFTVQCRDLQQKLIRPEGGLDASNTIDWLSYITIKDGVKQVDALVHLNEPFDYRGYRFFQSQFTPIGNAREITVRFEPTDGGEAKEVTIPRDGSADVPGIGRVAYVEFFPDFDVQQGGTASGDYNNPVAVLQVPGPDGKPKTAMAFNPRQAGAVYAKAAERTTKDGGDNPLLVAGNKVILKSFEKVALAHTLAVQYDPGRLPFYFGSALLILALMGVFLFSHQRVWAVVEQEGEGSKMYFGGNVNRNKPAFEARFNTLVQSATGRSQHE
jgi:cytochrome c biogenesis protein